MSLEHDVCLQTPAPPTRLDFRPSPLAASDSLEPNRYARTPGHLSNNIATKGKG